MAIKANFSAGTGLLKVIGDQPSNTITMSRNAAGQILINGGAVSIDGGNATVANTTEIDVFGQGGDDTIALDEANGALPSAHLFGGDGNDVLTGGSSADLLFGQSGNDTLLGKAGKDQLFGGDGNDTLIGGAGDDQIFGQAGNDRMIWNPGDGSDLLEGGDGNDTAEVNGGSAAETFTVAANGTRVRFDRTSTNPAPFFLDIGTTENLVLHAGGGNDIITAGNGLANLIQLTLDGGEGNDTITGGDGNDTLIGGAGDDQIFGQAGNDRMIWNPGDGSDLLEGGDGNDTAEVNGGGAAETFTVAANGTRVRFDRTSTNPAPFFLDIGTTENLVLHAGGGNDVITAGNGLANLIQLTLDGGEGNDTITGGDGNDTLIGGAGDDQIFGQAGNDRMIWNPGDGSDLLEGGDGNDTAEVNGGGAAETFTVAANGTRVRFDRTSTNPAPFFLDIGTTENLVLHAGGGNDVITAGNGLANLIQLTLDGGEGNDTITGGDGNDTLIGGDGNDTVVGGRGKDTALLGNGNDVFTWNPGDGSDTVEGQAGTDTLVFNGSTADETIDISANGSRVLLTRDVGTIIMDVDGTETIDVNASGGADNITINDLTGTDVEQVAIDLGEGAAGGGDGQEDTVFHQRDQRPRDQGHRPQRRGHGVRSGQHRDDLQLRGRHRSSRH